MEQLLAPGGTIALLVAFWIDTRRRTNGAGPVGAKLDTVVRRLMNIEERLVRLEDRVGEVEGRL